MAKTVDELEEKDLRSLLAHLSGPRGIQAIRGAAEKKLKLLRHTEGQLTHTMVTLEAKKNRVLGEISSQEDVLATLDLFLEESGLSSLVVQGVALPGEPPEGKITPLDPEIQTRIEKKLCLYRDEKAKFCARKLTSKEEQANKHCQGHWEKLEAGIDPGLVTSKRVARKK